MLTTRVASRASPLARLLEQAVPYAQWMAPFDPSLALLARRAGQGSLVFAGMWLVGLPVLGGLLARGFFWWPLSGLVGLVTSWYLPLLVYSGLLVACFWVIHHATRGLTVGNPRWHRLAFCLVIAAAPQPALIGVLVTALGLNVAIWLVWLVVWIMVRLLIILVVLALVLGSLRG